MTDAQLLADLRAEMRTLLAIQNGLEGQARDATVNLCCLKGAVEGMTTRIDAHLYRKLAKEAA